MLLNAIRKEIKRFITLLQYYKLLKGYRVIISDSTISPQRVFFEKKVEIRRSTIKSHTSVHEETIIINSSLGGYNRIGKNCSIANSQIGSYSYIADNSSMNNANIGNFCSIGPNFICGLGTHPSNRVSTSPYFYSPNALDNPFVQLSSFDEYTPITLGHDVWVGVNVFIRDGITIGHGAIIAAGSVVTKDVPPYAVVGGVPARIIKFRHTEKVINNLLESAWWEKSFEWIKENIPSFQREVNDEIFF